MPNYTVTLPTLHADQVKAYQLKHDHREFDETLSPEVRAQWAKNAGGRFKGVRCGRRWGKTALGSTWVTDGAIKGEPTGWFAPDYKKLSEAYEDIRLILEPIISKANKNEGIIRTKTGGRVEFWTLEDESAGRSRKYSRSVIDEGAFTKANMMGIWEKAILPTLFDYTGKCLVTSNTNGVADDNFMFQICNDPKFGFIEYHAPTINNPLIPMRMPGESEEDHAARRLRAIEDIKERSHPLVFAQEYEAKFVDWSGVAFFGEDKLLVDGRPVLYPTNCDVVFATLDTASKTGTNNDATGVAYWARNKYFGHPLMLLDYDLVQIEAATLETWLPTVLEHLDHLAVQCGARLGSIGVFIEDQNSGVVLLQQARNKGLMATAIDSKLTALGKDGRAISVSGYHYRGNIKITDVAYNKQFMFKGHVRNHLLSQVTAFRIGDKEAAKRADDLLDAYCYGIAIALGDKDGF